MGYVGPFDQFVAEAEKGGMVTLVCFIAVISRSFSRLGMMRKQVDRKKQWLLWSLGAVMLAHIFAYFGVAYWDQTEIWWFAFLAMISPPQFHFKLRQRRNRRPETRTPCPRRQNHAGWD